jgi:hypothetical protein
MHSQLTSSERSSTTINHRVPNRTLFSVPLSLITQFTYLSITAPSLQDHLQTIKDHFRLTQTPTRESAKEAWKRDRIVAEAKLADLNCARSNLVKELVRSDASQVLVDRRQRFEQGATARRVVELLRKVEGVRRRIEGSLQEKREMIAKQNTPMQHQPTSPHKVNNNSSEVIDVDAMDTGDSDFKIVQTASPAQPRTIKNTMRRVEALANEVETVAEFLDVGRAKVGEEVEKLIPAWEAAKKEDDPAEERKDVERMMTELAEAMQAVRDGVETLQSICMYAEQTDADEEVEMATLRKEMALVRLYCSCYVLSDP